MIEAYETSPRHAHSRSRGNPGGRRIRSRSEGKSDAARAGSVCASGEPDRALLGTCRTPDGRLPSITLSAFAEDARHYANGVTCPAHVITGEFDESCPLAAGERMAAALNAPFETLPALGHLAMMQAPAVIARKLTQFISGVKSP